MTPRHVHAVPSSAAALLLLAGFAGCAAVGPDYTRPEIATPDAWHVALAPEAARDSKTSLQTWWTVFDDPDLDELIELARTSNRDLKVAVSAVRASRARLAMSRGKELPRIDASAGVSESRQSDNGYLEQIAPPGGFDGQSLITFGVDAAWEIDVFGRIRRQIEAADAGYGASVEAYRDVLVTLFAEVALAYVEMRSLQQRIVNAEANVNDQREMLALTQDRFEAGVTSELDVAQARSNLRSTEATIPTMRIELAQALNRLAVLIGRDAGTLQARFVEPKPVPLAHEAIGAGVPADVLRQRPDVRRAERQLAAQTAMIGVATADLYPRFALAGTIGLESRSLGDLFDSSSAIWSVAAPVHWNVFSGGRVRNNIVIKEQGAEQALLLYEQTVLIALEEVENAIVSHNQGNLRRDRLELAVAATAQAVDLVTVQYDSGLTDFNNVLDMQKTLFVQQDDLIRSTSGTVRSLIALYKALGGGWDVEAAEHPPLHGATGPIDPPAPAASSGTGDGAARAEAR